MDAELKIISKYCGHIEARIRACKNRDIAVLLMKRLCTELEQNCKKAGVMNYLQQEGKRLLASIFDENGNNKLMEKKG